jgi:hypothetical protein
MEQVIREERVKRDRRSGRTSQPENREMMECLEKLKAWQTENLMAPHGMDKFTKRPEEKR